MLLARGPGTDPVVVNPGSPEGALRVAARLEQTGTAGLEGLVLTAGGWNVAGGADRILERWPARTLVVPANHARSASLRRVVARQQARGGRVRFLSAIPPAARFGPLQIDLAGRAGEQQLRTSLGEGTVWGEGPGFRLDSSGETQVRLPTEAGWQTVVVPCQTSPLDLRISAEGE
jgi:hypothetical protein